ncbi:hypothetical protein C1930_10845 [Stenotrophomonas sp. SAU14A_NAIMI4_8]|nr:hypothetical protein C1930_10845 [Stenotrophomonas sp. SAU14A_NAIMI4_8]
MAVRQWIQLHLFGKQQSKRSQCGRLAGLWAFLDDIERPLCEPQAQQVVTLQCGAHDGRGISIGSEVCGHEQCRAAGQRKQCAAPRLGTHGCLRKQESAAMLGVAAVR